MKTTSTYRARPVAELVPNPMNSAPATLSDEPNSFDILGALKMLGMELWNHVLLKIVFAILIARVLVPLAVVLTNDMPGVEFWMEFAIILAAPVCYGFFAAKSGRGNIVARMCVQWILFSIGFLFASFIGLREFSANLILIGASGVMLAASAYLGSRLAVTKSETSSDDLAANATWFAMLKDSLGVVLPLAVGMGLCIGSRYAASSLEAQVQSIRCVGKPAPALNFVSADEESWSLEDHQGKVIVVEFWAPHCMPCIAALGTLEDVQARFGQRGDFEMVGVSTGNKESSVEIFDTIEDRWTLLFPSEAGELGFKPSYIPMSYIIDRDGSVYAAGVKASDLEQELSELFSTIEESK